MAIRVLSAFSGIVVLVLITGIAAAEVSAQSCPKLGFNTIKRMYVDWGVDPLAAADLNGDGNQDLVTRRDASNIGIQFNDGEGNFGTPATYSVGNAGTITFADLNNDAHPELLYLHGTTLDVWANNGSGLLSPLTSISHTAGAISGVADFNGDTLGDIFSFQGANQNFSIRAGIGNGNFAAPVSYTPVLSGFSFANAVNGDFNGDGKMDVVASFTGFNVNNVPIAYYQLYMNDGSGTLVAGNFQSIGSLEIRLAVDFNNDGRTDVLGFRRENKLYASYVSTASGTFSLYYNVDVDSPVALTPAEFNGDGKKDFVVANTPDPLVNQKFHVIQSTPFGWPGRPYVRRPFTQASVVADFTGDGRTEIIERLANPLTHEHIFALMSPTCSFKGDPTVIDFGGDGMTETTVFRPSEGRWLSRRFDNDTITNLQFGNPLDRPALGDYDGDGRVDYMFFRGSNGTWYYNNTVSHVFTGYVFGQAGDKPVPADYDGDGKSDLAVYRPSDGGWYILFSSNNSFQGLGFGISTDVPVPSDYDGDGKTDVAVFRGSDGTWHMLLTGSGAYLGQRWGLNGDRAVPADYDGDGKVDVAVYRGGIWYILRSYNSSLLVVNWGLADDIPQPGVFRKASAWSTPAVFRPSTGHFYIFGDQIGGQQVIGQPGDIPISTPYRVE